MNSKMKMLQCSYEPSHLVEDAKIIFHMSKCKKNHRGHAKKTCPFNSSHQISEVEMNHHVRVCQSRKDFDEFRYRVEDNAAPLPELPPPPVLPDSEENWDDMEAATYNPAVDKDCSRVLTVLRGAQPAERRLHRMEQRRYYNQDAPQ